MLPGAPCQLLPRVSLLAVLGHARPGELLGAWVRGCTRPLRLRAARRALLASADLGLLLRRCGRVAVRDGGQLAVLDGQRLIGWRTLQIVTGAPFLPGLDQLRLLFPGLRICGGWIRVPLGSGSAEEVLGLCAAERLPVLATWIDYRG
ncbi:MAG: hypothetical protein ACJ8DJ_18045 [Gemmatimonadales bacterium]